MELTEVTLYLTSNSFFGLIRDVFLFLNACVSCFISFTYVIYRLSGFKQFVFYLLN